MDNFPSLPSPGQAGTLLNLKHFRKQPISSSFSKFKAFCGVLMKTRSNSPFQITTQAPTWKTSHFSLHETENGTRGWEGIGHGVKDLKKAEQSPKLENAALQASNASVPFLPKKGTRNCKENLLPQLRTVEK